MWTGQASLMLNMLSTPHLAASGRIMIHYHIATDQNFKADQGAQYSKGVIFVPQAFTPFFDA